MKTQTVKIVDLAPAPGESFFSGSQVDFDIPKGKIRVLGILVTAVAHDADSGDGVQMFHGRVQIDRQSPSDVMFGTSIYPRLGAAPVDEALRVPINCYTPCDFEIGRPNWLGIAGEYSLPASATAAYGVTTTVTFFYEEMNEVLRHRR